jgi:hypothetical protein
MYVCMYVYMCIYIHTYIHTYIHHVLYKQKVCVWPRSISLVLLRFSHWIRQAVQPSHNIEAPSFNLCCSGKAISITYSECACGAIVVQRAKRMHRTVIDGLSDWTIFSTIFHEWRDLGKRSYCSGNVFWLSVQFWSEIFPILRRIQWGFSINVRGSSYTVPVILVGI